MSDPLGPVTIGAREIYDQVIRLTASVDRLSESHSGTQHDLTDHEARIRSLERGRWPLPTLGVLISLTALMLAVLPKILQ